MTRFDSWFYHFAAIATAILGVYYTFKGKPYDWNIPVLFFAVANLTSAVRKLGATSHD